MLGIVDYGLGNMASLNGAFKYLDADFIVSSDINTLKNCSHLVLGGVGAFPDGMGNLDKLNLKEFLIDSAKKRGVYFLGICLGFQLLGNYSNEFTRTKGLELIDSEVVKIESPNLPVPHIGWNDCNILGDCQIFKGLTHEPLFYFVHSYHMLCKNSSEVVAKVNYGENIVAAIQKENIYGVQFHPEKSQKSGLMVLKNFMSLK